MRANHETSRPWLAYVLPLLILAAAAFAVACRAAGR